jgi:hypothetical protein
MCRGRLRHVSEGVGDGFSPVSPRARGSLFRAVVLHMADLGGEGLQYVRGRGWVNGAALKWTVRPGGHCARIASDALA